MNNCYRVMLGGKSTYAHDCISESFIGASYGMDLDFTGRLPAEWRAFNKQFAPVFLEKNPTKSRIAAGLACGPLWTLSKGIAIGDTVLGPDGAGRCHVGEVIGDYFYRPGEVLPHRRPMRWSGHLIRREDMSEQLRNSLGSLQAVIDLSGHRDEIDRLSTVGPVSPVPPVVGDPTVEDVSAFAMERHLEDFRLSAKVAGE